MELSKSESLPTILVMFGATGDLARRKLLPSLWQLHQRQELPQLFQIVGFSRREMDDDTWRDQVVEILTEAESEKTKKGFGAFTRRIVYQPGLFGDVESYRKLAIRLGKQDEDWKVCANKLFYLAVPPQYYQEIFQNLADSGLTEPCSPEEGWTRVVVEKPFGKDLTTAQELDAMLGRLFREEQIYRIDHYLGKDTVRNILAFRFSNTFLEPAWSAHSIDNIHVRFFEQAGAEDRGGFYDDLGALRDVGQNHMLQLLALFTMEKPPSFDVEAIRRSRTEVLEALEVMDQQDVVRQTVRGQYETYRQVKGVAPASATETYFRLQARVRLPRWKGVPIYLESGKRMGESKVEVTVTFRHETPCLCPPGAGKHYTNVLRYRIQPREGVYTSFWVKKPGADMVIEEKEFSFDYRGAYGEDQFIDAYTKLLLDVIRGDQTLFVTTPEIIASWRFIDPIEAAWRQDEVPLEIYEPGSDGLAWPPAVAKSEMPAKEIGYIGLGKMGSNMVERLAERGWRVVAFDLDEEARRRAKQAGAEVVNDAAHVLRKLGGPRLVWLMVPHQTVDDVLKELQPHLHKEDTVIDGGNSHYKESIERARSLKAAGINFFDIGVSGGPRGAREGACLMIGGVRELYQRYIGLFDDLSAPGGYDYMGESGAGHFVKMVHNGIEYGMMQALAEGFTVMKQWSDQLDVEKVANVYGHGSVLESRLVRWLKSAYATWGGNLKEVSGTVGHSGEGRWTIEAAKELGIPVPIIEGALQFRVESEDNPSYTGQILSALRNQFGGHEVKRQRGE